ncbi:MAG: T9SS type A sorting domain-containing protein [Flavobacteriales bacterium]|nr:T9SS type A sorting domain-containing protein [Flavobacteriales bacterium]
MSTCTSIDYCLYIANSVTGGVGCENADIGEDVILEYSIDGGSSWISIILHLQSDWDASPTWECFNIPIPLLALTSSTILRWRQVSNSACTGCDNWSLDEIAINCAPNLLYSWTPVTGLSDPFGDSTNLTIPADSTTYFLYIQDTVSGCDFTTSIDIIPTCDSCQTPVPNIISSLNCYGDQDGIININIPGSDGPFTVILYDSLGNLLDSIVGVLTDTSFTGLFAGTYTIESISTLGCANDTTATIIEPSNPLTVVATSDTVLCAGQLFSYSGTSTGGTGQVDFLWSTGDTVSGPISDSAVTSVVLIVTVSDQNGCVDTDTVSITVNPLPIVTIGVPINDTVCETSGLVTLPTGSPIGGDYEGTAVSGNTFDPNIAGTGTHLILYTYTNTAGCTSSDSTLITVENCTGIKENTLHQLEAFPNPFNERLSIHSNQQITTIQIINLEGKIVYELVVNSKTVELDLKVLSAGIYFLEATYGDGEYSRIKIVK